MKNYYFSENAAFLGYKMSTTLLVRKNDFTTVFVAQITDPPIKNGVNVKDPNGENPSFNSSEPPPLYPGSAPTILAAQPISPANIRSVGNQPRPADLCDCSGS